MKLAICSLFAIASTALAGTSSVSVGKGKGTSVPPVPPQDCPCYLTYRQAELSYVHLDGGDAGKGDGVDLRLNYEVAQGIFAYGDLSKFSGDVDNTSFDLGLGAAIPLCQRFHLIARAG